jgi:acetylornithine deacetylase/succinyl-diaminopimelate desuccinylase-like protein
MSIPRLRDEVIELARALIRLDTSNPPGNETPAAELVAEYLGAAGIECEMIGPDPERLNLVARIEGRGSGPSVMLLGHTDVVPASSSAWTVPPFEARLREGQLTGRGAVDMKNELASRAAAMAAFARSDIRPEGDVVLIAEADEERNTADVGMSWLVRERGDLRCDFALNEGGGLLLELADGRRIVTMSIGEKQVTSLRLRVFGRAGHASVPARADNPLRHAATAIERLLACEARPRVEPSVGDALSALGAPADANEAVAWAGEQHPTLADLVSAMTRLTVTPTGFETFDPSNVIPPFADVICDCRALPGETVSDVREHVDRALGSDLRYELELREPLAGGTESPIDTPLYRVCEEYVADRIPGAELFPVVTPGFTDSHWIRQEFSTVTYGFAPVFSTDPGAYVDAAHGADEALDLADLEEMAEFHLHVLGALSRPAAD